MAHCTPYSLDLSLCDLHVHSPLRNTRYRAEDITATVVQWSQQHIGKFLVESILELVIPELTALGTVLNGLYSFERIIPK
jgi:hypothetical protein